MYLRQSYILILKIRNVGGGVGECSWRMGRDSGKCLHQLDVLWVCGQPHIKLYQWWGATAAASVLNTQQRFVYMQRCRGSIPATPLRSQIIATLLKSTLLIATLNFSSRPS